MKNLEASGTPVNELDTTLALDGSNGGIHILGDDIAAVEHATGHVLAMPDETKRIDNIKDNIKKTWDHI